MPAARAGGEDHWLVTGATGLLGANAMLRLSADAHVVGIARAVPAGNPQMRAVDLSLGEDRDGLVARSGARAVLHAAAVSSIEAAERDPELAANLNVRAAADLARQASLEGARFVYVSTDAVFDGRDGDYGEDAETSPTSEYGRTKRDGELAVLDANPDAIIARVNFYGWSPSRRRSLAEFFHRELSAGNTVTGFADVVVSTMYVDHLVAALASLAQTSQARGVFHVASSEPISKYEFGLRLADSFGFDRSLVRQGRSSDVLEQARGHRLDLRVAKAEAALGIRFPDQASGLEALTHDHPDRPEAVSQYRSREGNPA
jgi:dTDP-4-dehydrorhamnose reductase